MYMKYTQLIPFLINEYNIYSYQTHVYFFTAISAALLFLFLFPLSPCDLLNAWYTKPYGQNKQSFVEVLGKEAVVRAHTHTWAHTNKTEEAEKSWGSLEEEMFFSTYCRRVRILVASVMLAVQPLWNVAGRWEIERGQWVISDQVLVYVGIEKEIF